MTAPTIEPIEYRIVRDLQAAFLAMASDDGYFYPPAAVAVKLDPDASVEEMIGPDGPDPRIVIELLPEARQYFPCDEVKITRPIKVHWVKQPDTVDDEDFLRRHFRGAADIEKASRVDAGRAGLALNTLIRGQHASAAFAPKVWTITDIDIEFYRTNGQP